MNLSQYMGQSVNHILCESIRNRDVEKALELIRSYLIKQKVYVVPTIFQLSKENKAKFGVMAYTEDNMGCMFVWDVKDSTTIEGVGFFKNFDEVYMTWALSKKMNHTNMFDIFVEAKGASITKMVTMTSDIMNGKVQLNVRAIHKELADAQLWENVEEANSFKVFESSDRYVKELERKKTNLYMRIRDWKDSGKDYSGLQKEYEELKQQLAEARLAVKQNVAFVATHDESVEKLQQQFEEEERATPEERFEDMSSYIQSVILGLRPLCVVCGAPGVGKTYRIMQAVKKEGKIQGDTYGLIKGKCTAANFYMTLHDYQGERDLVILDDADEIVKDDIAINLIKAATDSSDERWVSYGTSIPPVMSEDMAMKWGDAVPDNNGVNRYPKEFEFKGGMIIITNMRAGQLDTAIKNRALLCDLNFTVEEVLNLVRGIAPHIMPDKLTEECKTKAMDYLQEMADKKMDMEISIRSFTLVAMLYMSDAPEKAIQRRIREQMSLQFARGGKKY